MASITKKLLQNQALKERYLAKQISVEELAQELGYQPSYVATTLSRLGWKRPIDPNSTSQIERKLHELAQVRTEFRAFMAQKVLKNQVNIEKAAKICNCSVRTMYRYVNAQK